MIKNWIKSFLLIPVLYGCAVAQDPLQIKYADLLTEESAKTHLTILASTEFEGRGTGQEGGKKAAHYIASHFESLGLQPTVNNAFFQPLKLIRNSYSVKEFSINDNKYKNGTDFYVQGDNQNTVFDAQEIIFIGYGIQDEKYNDISNIDIENKIVLLINEGEPVDTNGNSIITGTQKPSEWATSRFKRIQELEKKNPKLILATASNVASMISRFGDRITAGRFELDKSPNQSQSVSLNAPVVHISEAIADKILSKNNTSINEQKKAAKTFVIKLPVLAEMGVIKEKFSDPNVLGFLPGTDLKEEIVIISGHYDHDGILSDGTIFPGADDNGSGTTAVLELAKAFSQAKKDGNGPRRSILFIGFAAEEKGLLGSQFYSENPIFPLKNTVTCLNLDMIGRIDDKHLEGNHNYIHLIGSDKLSSELYKINRKANDVYTKMELDYMYDDPKDPMRIYYRSDQYNFAKHGIPVTFYFSGLHPHYHTPDDTVDKIDFPMMVKREKLVFHAAWEIANRDQRLIVDSNKE